MAKRRMKGDGDAADAGAPSTKAEAVRRAIAAGKVMPQEGSAYIKDKFDMDVTPQIFSSYKSQLRPKAGPARPGRRPAARAAGNGDSSGAELARDVKALVSRYGPAAVRDMIDVFAD